MPITDLSSTIGIEEIPPEVATDAELTASIAAALIKTLSLFPRSSSIGSINGNDCLTSSAAGYMWVDGSVPHTFLPANAGTLLQGDGLWGTTLQGLYRVQAMISLTTVANGTVLWIRHQNNGAWAPWRML
jgi:hypothetical protein